MPDPRVMKMLRLISAKLDTVAATHRSDMLELDAEQEEQNGRLGKHDDQLADHERRLRRLENGRARR